MELKKLESGTDVRGTALPGYGKDVDLGPEQAGAITDSFALWLSERTSVRRAAVGCDARLSSPALKAAAIEALLDAGFDVLDCGMCSTPSMFMTTKFDSTACGGAVMVTASHHPAEKNGLKFFYPGGGISHEQLDEIVLGAEKGDRVTGAERGKPHTGDYFGTYCEFLRDKVRTALGGDKPLFGLKIAVDAGNGAGGFYVSRVLEPLGADCSGSRYLDPDGHFPNHVPNPENADAMRAVSEATVSSKSDLGVIFDTDVDRAAIVAADGREINRNALIALISAVILKENKGATIVTDSVTSDGLREFIEAHGGVHHRFRRGYKNVIDEAVRLKAPLAIETSGHAALAENYYLDDGAYLVTRLIIEEVKLRREGKRLLDLIKDLRYPLEEKEIRLGFTTEHWREKGDFIIESVKKLDEKGLIIAPDNHEGVRVSVPAYKGWFLLRMSVHDPIMPINIESDLEGGAAKIARLVYEYLAHFEGLDTSNLKKAL